MAIEDTFERLVGTFAAAEEAFHGLRLTVIEDRPPQGEVLLVERLGNLVEDMRGWLAEGQAAAADARQAVEHPPNTHRARQSLARANDRLMRLEKQFFNHALSHRMLDGLERFGRQRGGEWFGWSGGVVTALQSCCDPLRSMDEAMLCSWQELCAWLASGSFSISNINLNPQLLDASINASRRRPASAGLQEERHD
ncbi:MAG TPA: hypothetical protein VMU81_26150 [Acetobacteraceae bacterium]|nr:hypothetical protein [Acetobacteraceae bacterium]